MIDENKCCLCGEPMPAGEEMFNYHGFSGPCPKPALPKESAIERARKLACELLPVPYLNMPEFIEQAARIAVAFAESIGAERKMARERKGGSHAD